MRNLLEFLARFGGFFLFLILEALSFFLIVRFDDDKNRIFLSSSNAVAGYMLKKYDAVADYVSLPQELDQLQKENKRLREQLAESYYAPDYDVDTVSLTVRTQDSIYSKGVVVRDTLQKQDSMATQIYAYIEANVISNSINRRNNTLTIDRGTSQGIAPRMGVIGPQGIASIVKTVSKHYASVVSVLHSDISVSATVKHKGYFGALVWNGPDPRYMQLEAIPKHAEIAAGDTIVTSSFSGVFPAGLLIGIVESVTQNPGDNFHNIKVALASDMSRTGRVYVVQNKWLEEYKQVQKQEEDRK